MNEHDEVENKAGDSQEVALELGEETQVTLGVTLTNVDIPFSRMVVIILKWMLASIPALALFWVILTLTAVVLSAAGLISA